VCSTDVGDRWLLRHHPEIGPEIARTVGVLGIEHEIAPDGWSVTFTTVPAPTPGDENPSGWFAVNVSELDGDDVLAPFGGPVPAVPWDVVDGGTAGGTGAALDGGDAAGDYERVIDGGGAA
jgi:hypothetical protein